MHIGVPEITSLDGQTTWSVAVTGLTGAPDTLWFRTSERYSGMITALADPAIIGLLIPAMHAGDPMTVAGTVTDELAHNVRHGYQHVLKKVIGGHTKIMIETPNELPGNRAAPGVGTGFSAGVDSFAVIVDHYISPIPPDLRLTHLTYFNVGSHGRGDIGRDRFRKRRDRLSSVAADIGLPFVPVDSNLDDFYGYAGFQQTNGPRNISAATLLQGGLGRYYFASSYSYEHIGVRRSYDTAFSDPISLPLLTTRQFRPIPHGDEYTRVEKTILIASSPLSQAALDVCVRPLPDGRNCSQCWKCLRTELTLEITGRLHDFRQVFDLDIYSDKRAAYLNEVAVSKDEFAVEIREFAQQSAFHLPSATLARLRGGSSAGAQLRVRRAARRALSATGTLDAARSGREALSRRRLRRDEP